MRTKLGKEGYLLDMGWLSIENDMWTKDGVELPLADAYVKAVEAHLPLLEKSDQLRVHPTVGKYYAVKCIVFNDEDVVPVHFPPHYDKENGQDVAHYHMDGRYVKSPPDWNWSSYVRIDTSRVTKDTPIMYVPAKCDVEKERGATDTRMITESKIPRVCKNTNVCPHKGYNLKTIPFDEDGTKTCPMHGLKMNRKGEVVDFPKFDPSYKEEDNYLNMGLVLKRRAAKEKAKLENQLK